MTTLNTPAPTRRDTKPPPVPWRRLAWVSWRQYRMAAAGAVALLGVLALYLLIMGLRIRGAYAAAAACSPSAPGQHCVGLFMLFDNNYFLIAEISAAVLLAVPVLTGVFAGAPILARELDTGTFRFAWTQGAGRTRWTLARLALPAVAVTAAAAAFSQLFGWFFYPFFAAREFAQASAFAPVYFTLTGIAFAAWTLTAFAIGALAGVLIRRVVPAMAAALAAWAGLLLATLLFLRRHYETPLTTRAGHTSPSSWVVSNWWTGPNGQRVTSENQIIALLNGGRHPGYTPWTIYQPAARYWPFQLIEGGWLLALSLLLIAATIWIVRRRAA
jgi:hypothetical protein